MASANTIKFTKRSLPLSVYAGGRTFLSKEYAKTSVKDILNSSYEGYSFRVYLMEKGDGCYFTPVIRVTKEMIGFAHDLRMVGFSVLEEK